ncbi:MAG: 50S ribosomal protein L25 [bacterium]
MKLTISLRTDEKVKHIRAEGNVPAIVYGKHLDKPLNITCKKNDFIKLYKEAGYSTAITLTGEGVDQLVLIQDIQLDPVSDVLMHIDFLAVNKNEKVTTEIPLKVIGESSVEKLGLGKIQVLKDFVEVEAFPQDLPHDFVIDITEIQDINDTIFVKDIKVSSKVTVLDDPEQALVTVLILTEETEEAATVAPEAAAATPAKEEAKK